MRHYRLTPAEKKGLPNRDLIDGLLLVMELAANYRARLARMSHTEDGFEPGHSEIDPYTAKEAITRFRLAQRFILDQVQILAGNRFSPYSLDDQGELKERDQ